METKGFFNVKSSYMSYLALPVSFEYPCNRPTVIRHSFNPFSAGTVYIRQNLTATDVDFDV